MQQRKLETPPSQGWAVGELIGLPPHSHPQGRKGMAAVIEHGGGPSTATSRAQGPLLPLRRKASGVPPVPFRHRMAAASTGALLTSLVTNPLDVVKTRLQAQPMPPPSRSTGPSSAAAAAPCAVTRCAEEWCMETVHGAHVYGPATKGGGAGYRGTLDALATISRTEGLQGLYRGLGPSLLMAVPSTVLYYSLYDSLRGRIENAGAGPLLAPLVSGAGARTFAATVTAPLELVRTRAHTHHKQLNALRTMTKMVRADGLLSLWTGLGAQLWRDVPFSAMYWLGYETGVQAMGQGPHDSQALYMGKSFAAGAGAGMVAAFLTTPFDVIKTRLQVQPSALGGAAPPVPAVPVGASTLEALVAIGRAEGLPALFKGSLPRVLRIGPACAIMISSYEGGKHLYLKQMEARGSIIEE